MQLMKAFLYGIYKPLKMVDILEKQDKPTLGLIATILRSLLNSLFLFLPLFVLNKFPSMPSYLTFIKTEDYYLFLVFLCPFFYLLLWLFQSGSIYIVIRLTGNKKYEIDHILNIIGITSLIIGSILVLWDWIWVLLKSSNYVWLGISHLIIDCWFIFLFTISLKRILDIKAWIGVTLAVLTIILALFPAMLLMRSPI